MHFHLLLRFDGVNPGGSGALVLPPAGITAHDLNDAVHAAARQITVTTPPHPDRFDGCRCRAANRSTCAASAAAMVP